MILVTKEFHFDAAHFLPNHSGKCKNLHGHRWVVQVSIHGNINPETGVVLDFGDINKNIKPLIDTLDHSFLNENPDLPQPPTAENIALYLFEEIDMCLPLAFSVYSVKVYESPTSSVEVRGD